MIKNNLSFENKFTSECLINSWKTLKDQMKVLNGSNFLVVVPISKNWFEKTSKLIRTGKYNYYPVSSSRVSLKYGLKRNPNVLGSRVLKNLIIEISFLYALFPFFKNENSFDLAEYL